MSDLPAQGLFQQLNARPISGEHLEVLGKKASALWQSGEVATLNEAVVETVKKAGLSPEQVKRVIEFTNTDAYLRDFRKEGSHRVVNFPGGPANPSDILKDLNDGGGGSVFDRGTTDYHQPPRVKTASRTSAEMSKTASVELDPAEEALAALFLGSTKEASYPEVNPYGEVIELREKLASQYDHLTAQISGLESAYADLSDRVYFGVKQAALAGRTLGEVVQVWSTAVPSPDHIKIAFELVTPRLMREEVFHSPQELTSSIEKIGGVRMVNPRHPMVTDYQEYCATLSKLAELRAVRDEVGQGLEELTLFVKQAASGLVSHITGAARKASVPVGNAGRAVAEKLIGKGEGAEMVGSALETATKYAPHAAAVVGANEARRSLKYSPTWNKFQAMANPHSDQYRQREYELAAQGGYA